MTRYRCSMNPLLRQSVLVLWVVTRRGCPLPKVQKPPGSPQHQLRSLLCRSGLDLTPLSRPVLKVCVCLCFNQLRSLLCRSGLDLTPLSRPVRSRARSHVLVEHLCLPVELRRPTRPPRFLPRYHHQVRRGVFLETRANPERMDHQLPRRTKSYFFVDETKTV
jgi:hypothetical protein